MKNNTKIFILIVTVLALFLIGCGDSVVNDVKTDSIQKDAIPQTVTIQYISGGDTTFNCDRIYYSDTRGQILHIYLSGIEIYATPLTSIRGFIYE